jgi:broad specificity phosphatase PhoE
VPWQGLTYAEIDDRFPGARQSREADKWRYAIDGGESYASASERAKHWLAGCTAPLTVAVTHEMMSRSIQGAYAGLSSDDILARSPSWSLSDDDHAARRERDGDRRARGQRPLDPGAGGEQRPGRGVYGILHVRAEIGRLGDLA